MNDRSQTSEQGLPLSIEAPAVASRGGINRREVMNAFTKVAAISAAAAAIGGTVLANTNGDSRFNRRLALYRRRRKEQDTYHASPEMRRANHEHDLIKTTLERKHGCRSWEIKDPDDRACLDTAFAKVRTYERGADPFVDRACRAADLLMLTPAPTLGALAVKARIAEAEEIEDVNGRPITAILAADIERLLAGRV